MIYHQSRGFSESLKIREDLQIRGGKKILLLSQPSWTMEAAVFVVKYIPSLYVQSAQRHDHPRELG